MKFLISLLMRFIKWATNDQCPYCEDGVLVETSRSGISYLRIHYKCDYCGKEFHTDYSRKD